MNSNKKGIILIIVGITGIIFICTFDILMGKPVNDISGPKSIIGIIFSLFLAIWGIRSLIIKK